MATSTAQAAGNRSQANGVLPVTASQTTGNGIRPTAGFKPPTLKLKVIIRRLAPGLTVEEFKSILGDEWKLGNGKIDWLLYKPGKDSKDLSKPSRPSRAYLHLTSDTHLLSLSEIFRHSAFEDAQNTFNNPCLVGPPAVEFAPYGRIPGGKRRVDARAGTIDQDAEFMAFLEGLANPALGREATADSIPDGSAVKQEKVTTTPLVQYLKDKKANKSKESAAKAAKKQQDQSAKGKGAKVSSTLLEDKKKGKDGKIIKPEKASKEAVKILNRATSNKASAVEPSGADSTPPKLDIAKVPARQRGAATAAHIRMLQRDLGLTPAQAHRQIRRDHADSLRAEKAAAAEKAGTDIKESSSPIIPQNAPNAPKANWKQEGSKRNRVKGTSMDQDGGKTAQPSLIVKPSASMVLLKKPEAAPATSPSQVAKSTPAADARRSPSVVGASDGATQAFVKHANPSQGVTEALLKAAMEKFGTVSMVEIDKRKGFAYVDFLDTEGLKNAMAANPIPVAQGTVQVMQRKGTSLPPEKKPSHPVPHTPVRGGRGGRGGTVGRRGGRGGGRGSGNAAQGGTPETPKTPASVPKGPAAAK